MWTFFTLFFINLSFWVILFLSSSHLNSLYLLIGIFISSLTAYLTVRLKLLSRTDEFLFLQVGFYKFLFNKINNSFYYSFSLAIKLLFNKTKKFEPIIDYIYLENEYTNETCFLINLLNALPGVLCIAVKKKYLIVYSLGYEYFIPSDIFLFNQEVPSIYDNSLI